MRRRAFLSAAGVLAATSAASPARAARTPESDDLQQTVLELPGPPRLAHRALLLTPRHFPEATPVPLLVLLHGLGETNSEQRGIHAWGDLYGLVRAYEQLRRPPIDPTGKKWLRKEQARLFSERLAAHPFRGLAMVCPFTPNVYDMPLQPSLDRYADWIVDTLVPAAKEATAGVLPLAGFPHVGLDGCSLGGFIALEVFLRRPDAFGVVGVVQPAVQYGARRYARELPRILSRWGPRPLHLETSTYDTYRKPTELMSRLLTEQGVPHELSVPFGPHNQPFLRDVGTLDMLLWHDRQLWGDLPR